MLVRHLRHPTEWHCDRADALQHMSEEAAAAGVAAAIKLHQQAAIGMVTGPRRQAYLPAQIA